jgi:hypothetical protein
VGFIHERHGRISVETRSESFKIHPNYGYDETGNAHSDDLGSFGVYWREHPHPEFLLEDLDDLIDALMDARAARAAGVG